VLEVADVTPATIDQALHAFDLALTQDGRFWIVVPLAREPEPDERPTPPAPHASLETLIVTGTRHQLPKGLNSGSAKTLTAEQLESIPALGGDSIRVVNHLPGMSSVGISASPLVRGGLQDETLIRIDGVDLIEPFHLADFQSIFSAVDDRTVESIDVYTGGFPARYGNRMSGVMEMSTVKMPPSKGSEVGLSMFAATANTRGHNDDASTWWLGSARRGNLDLMVDRINSRSGSPKYWDAHASIGHRLSDATSLSVGALVTEDDVVFRDDVEEAHSRIDNRYLWLRLDARLDKRLSSTTVLAFVDSSRRKTERSPDPDQDTAGFLDYSRDALRASLRTDWTWSSGEVLLEFGGFVEQAETDYFAAGLVDRGTMGVLLGRPEVEEIDILQHVAGPSWGGYASVDVPIADRISIQPGLRIDSQDYDPEGRSLHVSPRLGVEWLPIEDVTVRLAAGRFHQPEAIYEMQVTDGVDHYFATQRADHFVAAMEWQHGVWSIRADGFHKRYENPKPRFENVFNPFVILPELEADRVAIRPSEARAKGFDLEARANFDNGWAASFGYGHLDADDRVNGVWVPRRWSQRHTLRGLAAWQGRSTQLAATLTWHSGWRTSQPPSFTSTPLDIETLLNNRELDDYIAVDVRLARTFRIGRSQLTLFADLANVLDRNNAAGVDYDVADVGGGYAFVPDSETLLPFIPSVGLRLSF